jgi:hypothetical protein
VRVIGVNDREMDDDSRETIEYLRAQPQSAVVRWASDHFKADTPWTTSWVDVRIPEGGPPDMGWVWTILDPADPEQGLPDQLWQFPWPFDLDVHGVFDPSKGWYVKELPVPAGMTLPRGLVAAYERLADQVSRAHELDGGASASPVGAALYEDVIARIGSAYRVRGGWSTRAVGDALSDWSARHAGRADLRFEWDREAGDSPALELARERAAAGGPSWDLGDGLTVADGLMDELLELMATDPEEAAAVTKVLREAVGPLLGGPPDRPNAG